MTRLSVSSQRRLSLIVITEQIAAQYDPKSLNLAKPPPKSLKRQSATSSDQGPVRTAGKRFRVYGAQLAASQALLQRV